MSAVRSNVPAASCTCTRTFPAVGSSSRAASSSTVVTGPAAGFCPVGGTLSFSKIGSGAFPFAWSPPGGPGAGPGLLVATTNATAASATAAPATTHHARTRGGSGRSRSSAGTDLAALSCASGSVRSCNRSASPFRWAISSVGVW